MLSICPGCGLSVESDTDELDTRYNASTACTALLAELSAYTLLLHDEEFIHQLVVDTYAASHWKPGMKSITLSFALIGLYLVCEEGYTGKEVQRKHMNLAKKKRSYPVFPVPYTNATLTIKDVLAVPIDSRPGMIYEWTQSVWGVWRDQVEEIASLLHA